MGWNKKYVDEVYIVVEEDTEILVAAAGEMMKSSVSSVYIWPVVGIQAG